MGTPTEKNEQDLIREENADLAAANGGVSDSVDPPAQDPPAPAARAEADAPAERSEPAPLKRVTAADEARAAMAQRFRQNRDQEAREFHGDFRDPTQTYGDHARRQVEQTDDPPAAADADAGPDMLGTAPAPKHKLKVNQKEVEVDDAALREHAQKSLAAEDILANAKAERDRIIADAHRAASARPHQDNHQPETPPGNQPGDVDASSPAPHQERSTEDILHAIQFGEPEEAAAALDDYVGRKVNERTKVANLEDGLNREIATRRRALESFKTNPENKDLVDDPYAAPVIENIVTDEYVKDLKALGYSDDRIPTNRQERANMHNFHRMQGHAVRDFATILDGAAQGYRAWKGGNAPKPTTVNPGNGGTPRVHVDRTARRDAIPVQPTRAAMPQRQQAPAADPEARRSQVIADMRRGRGQVVA